MSDANANIILSMSGDLDRQARRYSRSLQHFSRQGRRDLSALSRAATSLGRGMDKLGGRYSGMIVGAGVAYKSVQAGINSAKIDKRLIQIRQTAGATREMANLLRQDLHDMGEETGQSFDSLLNGFNQLVQAGMTWDQSLTTIKAINPAMAVTGSRAEILANSLTVAGEAFDFDLSEPRKAVELIDQMTVAGRLGNAELEDLSKIFARVGVNAKTAGLSFEDTLGFIEQLSMIEKNPERLATLADSTLRLFTNQKYLQNAAKATGVNFYDAEGERRAAFDVLDDIAKRYQSLDSDVDRDKAIEAAFGKSDQDTIRGLRSLLSGDAIPRARAMSEEIGNAGGTISRDLEDALENSVDQVGRLKNALGEAADEFAQPINDTIEKAIKYLLDEQQLSGKELMAGGALGAAGIFAGLKLGGAGMKKLGGKLGSLGGGVAAGKALEEAAGVQPVYVVNMPGGGLGGGMGPGGKVPGKTRNPIKYRTPSRWRMLRAAPNMKTIGAMGAGATGMAGLSVAGAGLAGYGAGSLISDNLLTDQGALGTDTGRKIGDAIGEGIARTLAFFGNDEAKRAVAINEGAGNQQTMKGDLRIKIDQEGRARVQNVSAENLDIDIDSGMTLAP